MASSRPILLRSVGWGLVMKPLVCSSPGSAASLGEAPVLGQLAVLQPVEVHVAKLALCRRKSERRKTATMSPWVMVCSTSGLNGWRREVAGLRPGAKARDAPRP